MRQLLRKWLGIERLDERAAKLESEIAEREPERLVIEPGIPLNCSFRRIGRETISLTEAVELMAKELGVKFRRIEATGSKWVAERDVAAKDEPPATKVKRRK